MLPPRQKAALPARRGASMSTSESSLDSPTIHIISGPGQGGYSRGCTSKSDFEIQRLASSLRNQGRVPQVYSHPARACVTRRTKN